MSEDAGKDEYKIVCNECGQRLDVLVSEVALNRMAKALLRAQHALSFAHGHIAHDGKPEHAYPLDFQKELRCIDEALKLADIGPRVLNPLSVSRLG